MKVKKQKLNEMTATMFEEEVYRQQLQRSHGTLGKDLTAKYDTGVEK